MSRQHEYQYVLWAPADMFDSLTVLAGTTGVRLAEEQTGMTAHQHGYRGRSSVAMLVDMSSPNECQLALNLALVAVGMGATIGKAIIPALENGAKRTQEE